MMPPAAPPRTTRPACSATFFCPGDSLQLKVNAQPGGTTFRFAPGVYRQQSITPKAGDRFIGGPGAILNGAALLTQWVHAGAVWSVRYAHAKDDPPAPKGFAGCQPRAPLCWPSEDLFRDGTPLARVASPAEVNANSYAYDNMTVTIGGDPTGHTLELTVTPWAFRGTGDAGSPPNVVISHLTILHYAGADAKDQGGVIWQEAATKGWAIDTNDIGFNHWTAVRSGTRSRVVGNRLHHNGNGGYGGYASDSLLLAGNEIDHNNTAAFNCSWQCGAGKLAKSQWARLTHNNVHDNLGKGIWMDIDNRYCVIDSNTVSRNLEAGIFHEIGQDCRITGNTVIGNGALRNDAGSGAGIIVANSIHVEIDHNQVLDNGNGIVARNDGTRGTSSWPNVGPYVLQDVRVHDNTIRMSVSGSFSGAWDGSGTGSAFSAATGVKFYANTYALVGSGSYFKWGTAKTAGALVTEVQWKADGQDVSSVLTRLSVP
jgi:parallel beta-helix repeat protein